MARLIFPIGAKKLVVGECSSGIEGAELNRFGNDASHTDLGKLCTMRDGIREIGGLLFNDSSPPYDGMGDCIGESDDAKVFGGCSEGGIIFGELGVEMLGSGPCEMDIGIAESGSCTEGHSPRFLFERDLVA